LNDDGGINGRRVAFLSYDDGYKPVAAFIQARRLVEQDDVLLIVQSVGTPSNLAIMGYMNAKKVPQLFVSSGATAFGLHPEVFPYTMGWQPNYQSEGRTYAKYIMATKPDARIAILFQGDGFGDDLLEGFKDGLGEKAKALIVAEAHYNIQAPSVDAQVARLGSSGADVLVDFATPRAAVQVMRKASEMGWKPIHIIPNVTTSIAPELRNDGIQTPDKLISTAYLKDASDPEWQDDPAVREWNVFAKTYLTEEDRINPVAVAAYASAQTLVQVLKQCGNDLSRENVMKQAAGLGDLGLGLLLPGIKISTSPSDYFPIEQMQMERFNGDRWERFGPILEAEVRG
jgi:branched-chain amino acid transport system substrate-binding protein